MGCRQLIRKFTLIGINGVEPRFLEKLRFDPYFCIRPASSTRGRFPPPPGWGPEKASVHYGHLPAAEYLRELLTGNLQAPACNCKAKRGQ
jgi:hypothetical protein